MEFAMPLRISGKQMNIGNAFRTTIEERIQSAAEKHFNGNYTGHVTVVKSGSLYSADCVLHLDTGVVLQTTGQAREPRLAFDAAAVRIETRLRRYKRRLRFRQTIGKEEQPSIPQDIEIFDDITHRIIEPVFDEEECLPDRSIPVTVAENLVTLRKLSVAEAVFELDMTDNPVFIFRNAVNNRISIVYRRADGNIGWIES